MPSAADGEPGPALPDGATPPRTRREARRASSEVVTADADRPVVVDITVETTSLPVVTRATDAGVSPTPPSVRRGRRASTAPTDEPTRASRPDGGGPRRARRASGPATGDGAPATESIPVVTHPTPPNPAAGRDTVAAAPDAPGEPTGVVAASTELLPAPPAATPQRAAGSGRRAASAFSDSIERPATGRRARVSVPTTVEIPATVEAEQAEQAHQAEQAKQAEKADQAASAGRAAPSIAVDIEVGTHEGGSGPETAAVPTIAPVTKAVSRRTLRAVADGSESTSSGASGTHGAARSTGSTAGSRRARSGERRPAAPPAGEQPGTKAEPQPAPETPSGADSRTASAASAGRRRRRRSTGTSDGDDTGRPGTGFAKGAFSVAALLFAAGIAVATTMPASALHAAGGVPAQQLLADVAPIDPALAAQQLTTSAELAGVGVTRDGYGVRDVAALRAAGMRVADTFTNNPNRPVQWPFPVGVPISDGFGPRESPGGIGSTDHKGVDFTPGQGTSIQSVADGVVRTVVPSDGGGLGVYVVIDHVVDGQAVSSTYGHLLPGSAAVTEGQLVKVGQTVGRVGNTGTSTGAHLHLEIRLDGVTPVDPFAWLTQHNA